MTKLKHNSDWITLNSNQTARLRILIKWLDTRFHQRDYPILIWADTLEVTINKPYSYCFKALLNDRYHKDNKDKLNWLNRLHSYANKNKLNWKGKHLYDVNNKKVVVDKEEIILMLGKYNPQDIK